MNLNSARYNMVHQQVQPWDVSNPKVLELMLTIPRERFVPQAFQHLAFSDTSIPIACNQVMLAPKIVGRLLQVLDLNSNMSVLEIGTGTGYVTALLSHLVKKLVSIEIFPELSIEAHDILTSLSIHNAQLEMGDAVRGWPNTGPYDAIIVTGSMPALPQELSDQLSLNGKLFVILGTEPVMSAFLYVRQDKNQWLKKSLFETVVPPLLNAPEVRGFQF